MTASKIMDLGQLENKVQSLRSQGRTIVLCHGVFDLLHIGHIRHFKQAKRLGDVLVVTITPDRYVDKGPHRPAFPESLRVEAIASMHYVDYVAINQWPTAEETLKKIRPDVFVKGSEFKDLGSDMTGKIDRERIVAEEVGTKIAFTEDIVFSSTNLINRYLSGLSDTIDEYMTVFRRRFSLAQILEIIESFSSLRILVIGDMILDEYQYCEAIGLSSKDPMMALKYRSHDVFAGGVAAVANHVAGFAQNVTLATVLGENDSAEGFVRSNLRNNISPVFWMQPKAPTTVKRRFIEVYSLNKLFEVYVMDDTGLPEGRQHDLQNWLADQMDRYDLVIAADFGHGAISDDVAQSLSTTARFLSINVQANASNRGYHVVTRYPRADYACMAEHEVRLQMRDKTGRLKPMIEALAGQLGCKMMVVTRGKKGCMAVDKTGTFVEVPAFALNVVDRVGAGDAYLSLTSLAAARNAPVEILTFLGSCAGSQAVGVVGNKKPLDKMSLQKYVTSLMK